jgi:hypothetical protein
MNNQHNNNQLNEGLVHGDLVRLVEPELHIDEYKSKMGEDEDIITLSFLVREKSGAEDLVSFIESGYDWVLDADVSSGELEPGWYLVFVEIERDKHAPERITKMIDEILNLTEQTIDEWHFKYRRELKRHDITPENITSVVPLNADDFNAEHNNRDIDKMKAAAGVTVSTKAPRNADTDSLRAAAGII